MFSFKQMTAYEVRISDWSSDVCSSDLPAAQPLDLAPVGGDHRAADHVRMAVEELGGRMDDIIGTERERALDGGREEGVVDHHFGAGGVRARRDFGDVDQDRKSTRLNSSH